MPVPVNAALVPCSRCTVVYDPRRVGGACPVCHTAAQGYNQHRREPADHALLLVAAATITNVVLLAILTVLLLR